MKSRFTPAMVQPPADLRGERTPPKPRRVRIEDLLGGGRELIIEHRNEEYRLRMTSNSKLILTK
jgi:hemin uptake protein HemP